MIHMKKMGLVTATMRVCSNLVIARNLKVYRGAQTVDILAARALAIVNISIIGFLMTVLIACSPASLEKQSDKDILSAAELIE